MLSTAYETEPDNGQPCIAYLRMFSQTAISTTEIAVTKASSGIEARPRKPRAGAMAEAIGSLTLRQLVAYDGAPKSFEE
jgi:hypothetical protein